MSAIANRRAYLSASQLLAKSTQPTQEMIITACETLAAVLCDLSGEQVYIVPLPLEEVQQFMRMQKGG